MVGEGKFARQIAEFRERHYNPALFRPLPCPKARDGAGDGGGDESAGRNTATAGNKK